MKRRQRRPKRRETGSKRRYRVHNPVKVRRVHRNARAGEADTLPPENGGNTVNMVNKALYRAFSGVSEINPTVNNGEQRCRGVCTCLIQHPTGVKHGRRR